MKVIITFPREPCFYFGGKPHPVGGKTPSSFFKTPAPFPHGSLVSDPFLCTYRHPHVRFYLYFGMSPIGHIPLCFPRLTPTWRHALTSSGRRYFRLLTSSSGCFQVCLRPPLTRCIIPSIGLNCD